MLVTKLFPVLGLAALMACNNSLKSESGDTRPEAVEKAKSGAPADASNSTKGSDIVVTIAGGPNAGVYKVHSAASTCSMGLAGDKSFGNQYSEDGKKDNEVSSVQEMVDDYDAAKSGVTENFSVMVTFGKVLTGTSYKIDPGNQAGSGKAVVTEAGSSRTVTVDGKTKDGIGLNVVITCHTTNKMVNGEMKEE